MRNQGRQAVPLHLAQLDHDVGAGLVPALRQGTHEGCPYASWFGGNAHRGGRPAVPLRRAGAEPHFKLCGPPRANCFDRIASVLESERAEQNHVPVDKRRRMTSMSSAET